MRPKGPGVFPPVGVALHHDLGARLNVGDDIGAVEQARIGDVRVVERAVPVFGRFLESRFLEMGGQQHEVVDRRVIEGHPVDMHGEGLVVHHLDIGDPLVELEIRDAAFRMTAGAPCEQDILRRHRPAIAPHGPIREAIGDFHARAAVFPCGPLCQAVIETGQFGAHHAADLPVQPVHRDRAHDEAQQVGLRQHGIDVGMKGMGELGNAHHDLFPRRRGQVARAGGAARNQEKAKDDGEGPSWPATGRDEARERGAGADHGCQLSPSFARVDPAVVRAQSRGA